MKKLTYIGKSTTSICFASLVILFVGIIPASGQAGNLPVTTWMTPKSARFIFYICGDGGMNKFSVSLCRSLQENGFSVAALDAKKYFWESKTPEQTSSAINAYLSQQMTLHPISELTMIGYSFGADVMPFIVNRLSPFIQSRVHKVLLVSPSATTDFEIHWIDMLGLHSKGIMNVVSEINKLNRYEVVAFLGSRENEFPIKNITLRSFHNEVLSGGHHFDGNPSDLSQALIKNMN